MPPSATAPRGLWSEAFKGPVVIPKPIVIRGEGAGRTEGSAQGSSPYGNSVSRSAPASLTRTRSSTRQPPSPPGHGPHRYFFRLQAHDVDLELERGAGRPDLERALEGHAMGVAELIGIYERQSRSTGIAADGRDKSDRM